MRDRLRAPLCRVSLLVVVVMLLGCPPAAPEKEATSLRGRVTSVVDGDSLQVEVDGLAVEVRLWGVDCPEGGQPGGEEARSFVEASWLDRWVEIEVVGIDRYGRTVAIVRGDSGEELNSELLAAGWAWWYRRYAPRRDDYQAIEAEARQAGRGLWSQAGALPPWEWRDQQR
ncbi:MAG: thermonuclease family protein [Acidobacteriota bacterium]